MEVWTSVATARAVETTISIVRHGPTAGRALDGDFIRSSAHHQFRNLTKRVYAASGNIQRANAAAFDDANDEFSNVVNQYVIAPLFAFAEQKDVLTLIGKPPKSVRPVPIVGIGRTIEQTWTQHGERRANLVAKCQLASQMHDAMKSVGRHSRFFRQWT